MPTINIDTDDRDELLCALDAHRTYTEKHLRDYENSHYPSGAITAMLKRRVKRVEELRIRAHAVDKRFTVFCRQASNEGTTWITTVDAEDQDKAASLGLKQCSADWEMDEDDIAVIGILAGQVDVLSWDDLT